MKARLVCTALALLVLGLAGCAQNAQDPIPTVERFLAARQARNLNATMDVFADQPQLRSSAGVNSVGREAVRAIVATRLSDTYTVDNLKASGERVTWSERVRRNAFGAQSPPAVFDQDVEVVVRDGHISSMATYLGSAHSSSAADASAPFWLSLNVLLLLSILGLVAAAVLVWPSAALRKTPRVANGHLLDGLRDYVARRGID